MTKTPQPTPKPKTPAKAPTTVPKGPKGPPAPKGPQPRFQPQTSVRMRPPPHTPGAGVPYRPTPATVLQTYVEETGEALEAVLVQFDGAPKPAWVWAVDLEPVPTPDTPNTPPS
jgi:hypothetical protein